MGFFDKIKGGFKSFKKSVSHTASNIKNLVVNAVKPVIKTVGHTINNVGNFAGREIDKVVTAGTTGYTNITAGAGNTLTSGGKAIESVGQGVGNFMPWLAVGGAILGIALLTR